MSMSCKPGKIKCLYPVKMFITSSYMSAKMTLNASKSTCPVFTANGSDATNIRISLGDTKFKKIKTRQRNKFRGLWVDNKLSWNRHNSALQNKLNQGTYMLKKAKKLLDKNGLQVLHYAHFHSHLAYSLCVWGGMCKKSMLNKLQKMQNVCIRLLKLPKKKRISTLNELIELELCKLGYKSSNKLFPLIVRPV